MFSLKKTFRGGVHPDSSKTGTRSLPIEEAPLPDTIFVSLAQHIGAPAQPLKEKRDAVSKGELIGESDGRVTAKVHSPVSGTVKRIVQKPLPGGKMAEHMEIEVDREQTEVSDSTGSPGDAGEYDREEIIESMEQAGIVGMGGATFPTHIKLAGSSTTSTETLIVNGAECEPYLTCDHRLMVERSTDIVAALKLLYRAFALRDVVIAIEANKPDAISAVRHALDDEPELPARVVELAVKYPHGAEKMLVYAATGLTVPAGGLPIDVGVVVSNVSTVVAMYEAIELGKPLIDRVITVTGGGIQRPANLRVPIGTPFEHLAEVCGGMKNTVEKIVVGGPMMGIAVPTLDYAVTKGISGLVFLEDGEPPDETPCIRCGRCIKACPINLMPLELAAYAKAGRFAQTKTLGAMDCFECGSCAFTCPAKIPITAWIRYAKNYIRVHGVE